MTLAPSPSWNLHCARCGFYIVVNARGAHGKDEGAGVEAARRMNHHSEESHPGEPLPYPSLRTQPGEERP